MRCKVIKVIIAVFMTYIFLNLIMPRITSGVGVYILSITTWLTLALLTLKLGMREGLNLLNWRKSDYLTLSSAIIGVIQVAILIFAGLFTSFGRSPYAHTPIAITIGVAYFTSALVGFELSRAYIMKYCPKRKIFTGMLLTSLFYTFTSFPLIKFLSLERLADVAKFLCSDFLPTFAQSLLATYLILLGGPTASIAYLGVLEAFEWLSPILPNPPWAIKALITTITPTFGFLLINETVSPIKLAQTGIVSKTEITGRIRRKARSSTASWLTIMLLSVILIWGSTGLLGFQPSIIASGSMRPTMEVGDIAITVKTPPDKIRVGDIIQYWREGDVAPTIHRVMEISHRGGMVYIVTKGDANNVPDDPITTTQPVGKVILIIPKVGWASIYLKQALKATWENITGNPTVGYTLLAAAPTITAIAAYKKRRRRRWRKWRP